MDLWLDSNTSTLWPPSTTTFHVDPSLDCENVHNYARQYRCRFVKEVTKCGIEDGLIDYTRLLYCTLSPALVPLAVFVLLVWLGFLFIAMAVSADDFFCPTLVVISRLLRMSDNIAGVTLLALGNGAPDVFSAIAAIRNSHNGEIGLAIGALIGAGVFVTTVVSGSICLIKPFHMAERPFLRDVIFYIGAIFMTYCVLNNGLITLGESIGYIVMYAGYVAVVVLGRYIYQRQRSSPAGQLTTEVEAEDGDHEASMQQASINAPDMAPINPAHSQDRPSEATPLLGSGSSGLDSARPPLRDFFSAVGPLDVGEFKEGRLWTKVYLIFKAPALFIFTLAIPVVDFDRPLNGWNRHLNSLHCLIAPVITLAVTLPNVFLYNIGGHVPVYALILVCGTVLAVIVFLTSKNDRPPVYHMVFAFLGFMAAIMWIEALASEIVNILTTIGVVFKLSSAILGLTLLAWGNSIADYIADIAMAKNGFPRAGFSACYGGPLFNILLGIGIPFTIKAAASGSSIEIEFTLMQVVLIFSLLVVLAVTLALVPLTKFRVGRALGVFLIVLYVLFMALVVMTELGVFGDPTTHIF